jgi:uncharacterized protein (TIGR03083 family)
VRPEDLTDAAAFAFATLEPELDRDWNAPAGSLQWSCRQTLDHIVDCQFFYAGHLARRATSRLPSIRDGDATVNVDGTLTSLLGGAAILADVARAAPPEARGFHPGGMADADGFLAMGCDETLVHGWDIAEGLDVDFEPPVELAERVVRRLFPWAPKDEHPWDALLWANGRIPLDDLPQEDEQWYWWCAPLAEWDGKVARRTHPPGWI